MSGHHPWPPPSSLDQVKAAINREPFVYYGADITGETRTISAETHDILLAVAREHLKCLEEE